MVSQQLTNEELEFLDEMETEEFSRSASFHDNVQAICDHANKLMDAFFMDKEEKGMPLEVSTPTTIPYRDSTDPLSQTVINCIGMETLRLYKFVASDKGEIICLFKMDELKGDLIWPFKDLKKIFYGKKNTKIIEDNDRVLGLKRNYEALLAKEALREKHLDYKDDGFGTW